MLDPTTKAFWWWWSFFLFGFLFNVTIFHYRFELLFANSFLFWKWQFLVDTFFSSGRTNKRKLFITTFSPSLTFLSFIFFFCCCWKSTKQQKAVSTKWALGMWCCVVWFDFFGSVLFWTELCFVRAQNRSWQNCVCSVHFWLPKCLIIKCTHVCVD